MLSLLGIADKNNPDAKTPGSPYVLNDLRDYLLQSDLETRILIAQTLNHPFRNALNWVESDAIEQGGEVPQYMGSHRGVFINYTGGGRKVGQLAQHFDHLNNHRFKGELYGPAYGLYWIENGHIYFYDDLGDAAAVMEIPNLSINRTASGGLGSLSSPVAYEWAVVCNAMKVTPKYGRSNEMAQLAVSLAADYERMITEKALSLPVPEVFKRLAT